MFAEYLNSQLAGVMKSFGCAPSVVDDDLSPDRVARNARAVWVEICDDHDLQPGIVGTWFRNIDPNLPAPISPARTGRQWAFSPRT
jgi:hypothetical protein